MTGSDGRVLWVTGAGSGMGRAAAVAAAPGRRVALSGRRAEPLAETAALVERAGGQALVRPLDARDGAAVAAAHAAIVTAWGGVDDLVLSAGLNTPQRTWADQSLTDLEQVIATNLTAVARAVDAVLPDLRERGGGQVVVVSSYAAWRFTPYAGSRLQREQVRSGCPVPDAQRPGGRARRSGLPPLPRRRGHRLPRASPVVPGAESRAVMLTPDDVGRAVLFVLDSPAHVRIDELVISPLSQR